MNNDYERVFCYGTLTHPETFHWVTDGGSPIKKEPYSLFGYNKYGLNIKEEEGGEVKGFVLTITTEQLKQLDRYEGSSYKRIKVKLEDGEVWAYQVRGL